MNKMRWKIRDFLCNLIPALHVKKGCQRQPFSFLFFLFNAKSALFGKKQAIFDKLFGKRFL